MTIRLSEKTQQNGEKWNTEGMRDNGIYLFMDSVNSGSCKSAMEFIIQHNLQKNRVPRIQLMICSPGGSVDSCFALIETMKGSAIPVHTTGLGLIASCGILLFMSGFPGERVLTPNTSILSHQFSWGTWGKEHELFASQKEFDLTGKRMRDHYRKCTGLDDETIDTYLLPPQDVWLTAQEAKKYNICDKVKKVY
jgi:ATP-dependent Clp protease protease subunit